MRTMRIVEKAIMLIVAQQVIIIRGLHSSNGQQPWISSSKLTQLRNHIAKRLLAPIVVAQQVLAFQTLAQNVISPRCASFSGLRKTSLPSVLEAMNHAYKSWGLNVCLSLNFFKNQAQLSASKKLDCRPEDILEQFVQFMQGTNFLDTANSRIDCKYCTLDGQTKYVGGVHS